MHRQGPYRFFFYSNERGEPPHVHVERDRLRAKFWLAPVGLADAGRFPIVEARRIEAIVEDHRIAFLGAWDEYFAD